MKIYRQIVDQQITGPKGELIRIEMFAHGALCMAVSGKCYLSLHEMNASANRGACMQICRRAYSVKDKDSNIELDIENQYIMSPKDIKTIHFMNKMMDAGVRVFKIEGRARGPEYVRLVTECYKEAVRAYCNGTFDEKKVAAWDERLRSVSTEDSGTAIIWGNGWVSGVANMAPARLRRKCMLPKESNISTRSAWRSSKWNPVT